MPTLVLPSRPRKTPMILITILINLMTAVHGLTIALIRLTTQSTLLMTLVLSAATTTTTASTDMTITHQTLTTVTIYMPIIV